MVFSSRVMLTLWGCPLATLLCSTSISYGSLVPPRLYRICKFPTEQQERGPVLFRWRSISGSPHPLTHSPTAAAQASHRPGPFHAHSCHFSREFGSTTQRPGLIVPEWHMSTFAGDKHQWPLSSSSRGYKMFWTGMVFKNEEWGQIPYTMEEMPINPQNAAWNKK